MNFHAFEPCDIHGTSCGVDEALNSLIDLSVRHLFRLSIESLAEVKLHLLTLGANGRRSHRVASINVTLTQRPSMHELREHKGSMLLHLAIERRPCLRLFVVGQARLKPVSLRERLVGVNAFSRKGRVTVNNAEAYIACCLSGLGLIQIPAYDVEAHISAGELVEVLPEYRAAPMPVTLLYPHRQHLSRRFQVFADWLVELVRRRCCERVETIESS